MSESITNVERSSAEVLIEDLTFTKNLRKDLIQKIAFTDEGIKVPDDKEDKALLVKLMDGLDKLHISVSKVQLEEKANESQGGLTNDIRTILRELTPSRIAEHYGTGNGRVPDPGNLITTKELLPGQGDQGINSFKISDFLNGKV